MEETPVTQAKKLPRWPLYLIIILGLIIGLAYSLMKMGQATMKHKPETIDPYQAEFFVPGGQNINKSAKMISGEQNINEPANMILAITSDIKPEWVKLAYYSLTYEEAEPTIVHKKPPMQKPFAEKEMIPAGTSGYYVAKLEPLGIAEQYYYYFKFIDKNGNVVTYPKKADEGKVNDLTYRGPGIAWVTMLHFVLIMMVLFFLIHTVYYTLMHLASKGAFTIKKIIANVSWLTLFFFITSFPIGCWVSYNAYGRPWTGIPIVMDPNDVDNKSLFIFIYWIVIILLIRGIDKGKDKISPKAFAWLSLIGAIATIYFFLSGGHN